jgi:hypothetical protein
MPLSHANVSGIEVELSDFLTTPGVILDNDLTFNNLISHLFFILALSVITDLVLP